MNSLVIYPSTEQQFSLIQLLMNEMKVRFSVKNETETDDSLFTEEAYFAMLDERIKNAEQGNYTTIRSKQELEHFLNQL